MNDLMIMACPPKEKKDQLAIGILHFVPGPNLTDARCQQCDMTVLLGVKQREALTKTVGAVVMCFRCAMLTAGPDAEVKNMGGQGSQYQTDQGSG